MPGKILVDVGIRIDDKQIRSAFSSVLGRLSNVGELNISDDFKQQIKEMMADVEALQKKYLSMSQAKLNTATFEKEKSAILDQVNAIEKRTSILETTMMSLISTMSNADSSGFTNWIKEVLDGMKNLTSITNDTVDAISNVTSGLGKGSEFKIIDTKSLIDQVNQLKEAKEILKRVADEEFGETGKYEGSLESGVKEVREAVNEYIKLKNKLSKTDKSDPLFSDLNRQMADASSKIQTLINQLADTFGDSIWDKSLGKTKTGGTTDILYWFDKIVEDARKSVTKINDTLSEIGDVTSGGQNQSTKITLEFDTSSATKDLSKKISQAIKAAQRYASTNPIEVEIKLATKWDKQTKQYSKAFEKMQKNINKIEDEETRGEFQSVLDEIGKGWGKELLLNFKSSIGETESEINALLKKIQTELKNAKFAINPKIEFDPQEISNAQSELDKISKNLRESIIGASGRDVTNSENNSSDSFAKLEKRIFSIVNNLKTIPDALRNATTEMPELLSDIPLKLDDIINSFREIGNIDLGTSNVEKLLSQLEDLKNVLHEITSMVNGGDSPLSNMISGWNSSDEDMISKRGRKHLRERSAVLGKDGKLYGEYAYDGAGSTGIKYSTINRMKSKYGVDPYIGFHSHAYDRIAAPSTIESDNIKDKNSGKIIKQYSGDIKAWAIQLKEGIEKQVTVGLNDVAVFDAKGFYQKYKDIDFTSNATSKKISDATEYFDNQLKTVPTLFLDNYIDKYGSGFEGGLRKYFEHSMSDFFGRDRIDIDGLVTKVKNNIGQKNLNLSQIIEEAASTSIKGVKQSELDDYFVDYFDDKALNKAFGLTAFNNRDFQMYRFRSITPDIYKKSLGIDDYASFMKYYTTDEFIKSNPLGLSDGSLKGLFSNSGIGELVSGLERLTGLLKNVADVSKQISNLSEGGLNFGLDDSSAISQNIERILSSTDGLFNLFKQFNEEGSGIDRIVEPLEKLELTLLEFSEVYQKVNGILSSSNLEKKFSEIREAAEKLNGVKLNTKAGKSGASTLLSMYEDYLRFGGTSSIEDIGAAKNITKYLNKHLGESESVEAMSKEAGELREVESAADIAASAKERFAKANSELLQSVLSSVSGIDNEGKAFENLNKLLNNLGGKNGGEKLSKLVDGLKQIQDVMSTPVGADSLIKSLENLSQTGDALKDLATVLRASKKEIDNASGNTDQQKTTDKYNKFVKQFLNKQSGKLESKDLMLANQRRDYTPEFKSDINDAVVAMKELNALREKHISGDPWGVDDLKRAEGLIDQISKTISSLGDNNNILARTDEVDNLIRKLSKDLNDNTISGSLKDRYQGLIDYLMQVRVSSDETKTDISQIDRVSFGNLKSEFMSLNAEMERTGQTGKGFFKQFQNAIVSKSAQFLATYFSLQDFVRYARELGQTVTEINSAQTELRKVSDASQTRIQENFETSAKTAQELGATITDVINSTSDWARLGYSVDDAEKLARVTQLYQTVGDNMTQESASESLISTMKGFQLETDEAERVVDRINEVANHFAIDTAGIGESLQRSASAFNTAHTDLDKSIALITASNTVLQDPEKVGTMWNTNFLLCWRTEMCA